MRLESARPGDLADIKELLRQHGLPGDDLGESHLAHFLVLRDGAAIAGVAGLEVHGGDGLLRSVAVSAASRSQGRGAGLVSAIEARARRLKLSALYLLTTDAADYFARAGYRRVERGAAPAAIRSSAEFAALCPDTAVCMQKPLS